MPIYRTASRCTTPLAGAALIASLALAGGCGPGLGDIDRKIDRLVAQQSRELGGGARNAADGRLTEPPESEPGDTNEDASTTNPDADQLAYSAADESRDVAARLSELAIEQLEGADPLTLDLPLVFRQAQLTAREYLTAQEEYVLAAIRLLIERHLWSPRFFNDTTATLGATGDAGSFEPALNLINELRVAQRLPYGGSVEASWVTRATQQLREAVTDRYEQSSEFVVRGDIPLMRGAGDVAREGLIQAERDLIYAARSFERFRRSFLVDIAGDYFSLLNLRAQITNQQRQLESLQVVEARTQELVDAGRESAFRTKIVSNQVLSARASLASLRESYILALDRFKVRLGLEVGRPLQIADLEFSLPDPAFELDEVTAAALDYRLDLQNTRDRVTDQRRGVDNARNAVLPDLDLTGRASLPTDPNQGSGFGFDPDYADWSVGVTFGLPLDREIERLGVRQSVINFERSKRNYEQARDNVIVDARGAARSVELARFRLQLAELQVEINESRLQEQQLKSDEVDPQTIVDTENELLDSQNARDQAETDLRNAILRYLLSTGQLRVGVEGGLDQLPGMEAVEAGQMGEEANEAAAEAVEEEGEG